MGEYSFTTCDWCAYDGGASYGDPGFYEGSASSAVYEGWGIAVRKYRTTPMTLGSGYVIEARDAEETNCICPRCLLDDECMEKYEGYPWNPHPYDGEHLKAAIQRRRDAEEAENEREMREETMRMWVDINGAPHCDRSGPRTVLDYCDDREHYASVATASERTEPS